MLRQSENPDTSHFPDIFDDQPHAFDNFDQENVELQATLSEYETESDNESTEELSDIPIDRFRSICD